LPTSAHVHIWVGRLEPKNPDVLSQQELDRARRYLNVSTRDRYISRAVMLREIIGHYLNIPPEAVELSGDRGSRPRLLNRPDLVFSVSKAAGTAIFAFRVGDDLGVDIEVDRPGINHTSLAEGLLTVREHGDLAKVPPERRNDVLIQAWTRKEAYVKGLGAGLGHGLGGFETGIAGSWSAVVDPSMTGPTWWVTDLPPLDRARLALATAGSPTDISWFGV
jgi:4'-phosphopantetheinyl transferase